MLTQLESSWESINVQVLNPDDRSSWRMKYLEDVGVDYVICLVFIVDIHTYILKYALIPIRRRRTKSTACVCGL